MASISENSINSTNRCSQSFYDFHNQGAIYLGKMFEVLTIHPDDGCIKKIIKCITLPMTAIAYLFGTVFGWCKKDVTIQEMDGSKASRMNMRRGSIEIAPEERSDTIANAGNEGVEEVVESRRSAQMEREEAVEETSELGDQLETATNEENEKPEEVEALQRSPQIDREADVERTSELGGQLEAKPVEVDEERRPEPCMSENPEDSLAVVENTTNPSDRVAEKEQEKSTNDPEVTSVDTQKEMEGTAEIEEGEEVEDPEEVEETEQSSKTVEAEKEVSDTTTSNPDGSVKASTVETIILTPDEGDEGDEGDAELSATEGTSTSDPENSSSTVEAELDTTASKPDDSVEPGTAEPIILTPSKKGDEEATKSATTVDKSASTDPVAVAFD